jgi:uncharacterized RDD family membrane protein YckC
MATRKPRFEPEGELWNDNSPMVAEQSEEKLPERPRFVPDPSLSDSASTGVSRVQAAEQEPLPSRDQNQDRSAPDPSWRDEVASRVNSYRAKRRPQKPRFPSLSLKFESLEPIYSAAATRESVVPARESEIFVEPSAIYPRLNEVSRPETGRLIEFPRLARFAASGSELADPVTDIPRILEAPELAPPPPAMGGILIDSLPSAAAEKRPGIEIPLQLASMSRRVAASLIDAGFVLVAFGVFAAIFYRITGTIPDMVPAAESAIPVLAILWFGYQYLNLVHTGSTPGLKLVRLQLNCFDGNTVAMGKRRWRVLTSVLSLASVGLGYAWSLIDEDQLCWHDRVTATHIAPQSMQKTESA